MIATTGRVGAFSGGDPVSRVLIDIAAGRPTNFEDEVPAGLVELAQRHGLIRILADATGDRLVRAIGARESARAGVLDAHLRRILTGFKEAGIRVAVLKGPAVAERYRRPDQRPYSDLDLLVSPADLDPALEHLAADPSALSVPAKRPKADKRDVIFEDESGMRFNVDLHWDLFSYSQLRESARGATDQAWARSIESSESPLGPLWEIPDSFRLPFLCSHAVLDHRFRLILFRDLLEFATGDVDWDGVEDVSRRWGLRSTTHLALWITRTAFGAPIPAALIESLRPRSLSTTYLERALPKTDVARFDGHHPHPINLAIVTLHDDRTQRLALLVRSPTALPRWRSKVAREARSMNAPRVLILVSTNRRRGAEVFTERLREGLTSMGWVAEAVSLKGFDEIPGTRIDPLTTANGRPGRRFDLRISRRLRAKIRTFRPDIVVANGGATLRYAAADSLFGRYRLVYIGIGEPKYWLRSRVSRWLNRLMLKRTDRVLAVSDATRDQLLALEPSLDGRVLTTYTGVPGSLFQTPKTFAEGPLRVLMVGSLTGEKDPMRGLRVVARLTGSLLRFVGDGPLLPVLRSEASRLGISDRVEFTGSVADVRPHLEWGHVLILTSLSEGLPGVILEAGAAGLPTVAVDVGGVREAISDEVSGYVTASDDDALVAALQELDSDRERLAAMGAVARHYIESRFKLEDVVRNYASALRDVAR